MLSTILIVLSVVFTGFFLLVCVNRRIAREKGSISAILRSYFESEAEDKPSEFAKLIEVTAEVYAQKVTQNLKATFMGIQSVDSRQEQGINTDIISDLATQKNPLLAEILQSFPAVKKRIGKNPALLGMALEKLGGLQPANSADRGNGDAAKKFKNALNNYK